VVSAVSLKRVQSVLNVPWEATYGVQYVMGSN